MRIAERVETCTLCTSLTKSQSWGTLRVNFVQVRIRPLFGNFLMKSCSWKIFPQTLFNFLLLLPDSYLKGQNHFCFELNIFLYMATAHFKNWFCSKVCSTFCKLIIQRKILISLMSPNDDSFFVQFSLKR
jgi:hypothetical protein